MFSRLWFKAHWILGLGAGLVLVVVGLSGAALSYEKEILRAINKNSYTVEVPEHGKKLPLERVLAQVQGELKKPINALALSSTPNASMTVTVAGEGANARRGVTHYVNPYTGELLPQIQGQGFFMFMQDLHRRLTYGSVGKQIVGASSLILLVLVLSGIYLYWPRIRRGFGKSLTFNVKSKGRYFLYSMHSAIGMWVTLLYVLAVLTGLYWSYDWYRAGLHIISGVPAPVRQGHRQGPPQEVQQTPQGKENAGQARLEQARPEREGQALRGQERGGQGALAQEQTPQREGRGQGGQGGQGRGRQGADAPQSQEVSYASVAQAWTLFEAFLGHCYESASLRIPTSGSAYSFSYLDANSAHSRARNQLELDVNTWQLLSHDRYEDKPLNERLMRSMLPLHSGEYFGEVGRALMFAACVLMLLFFVTGVMLYVERFKRERKKKRRQNT